MSLQELHKLERGGHESDAALPKRIGSHEQGAAVYTIICPRFHPNAFPPESCVKMAEIRSTMLRMKVTVEVEVKNLGPMVGDRAVLLSLRRKKALQQASDDASEQEAGWPVRWLVDFTKVHNITAGGSKIVTLQIAPAVGWLQWFSAAEKVAGEFELLLSAGDAASALTLALK